MDDKATELVGVSSLASGADILFAEAVLAMGGMLHLILPLNEKAFLEESVRPSGNSRWEARFTDILPRATAVEIHGDEYFSGSGSPFQLAAMLIDGTAQLLASRSDGHASALAVWDGQPGDGLGGTASFVGHCVAQGRTVRAINPRTGVIATPGREAIAAAQKYMWRTYRLGELVLEHRLAAFLFADAKGFGGLTEAQIPAFAHAIEVVVRSAIRGLARPPLVVNTWGDGLFVVCESPADAAELALRLTEGASRFDWARSGATGDLSRAEVALGLPPISFRAGLHAGPAFFTPRDMVVERPNAFGRDVSLAARIEPVVTPGQAWASRAFVVLAAGTGARGYRFEDLGQINLAKEAGRMRLYAIHRAHRKE